MKSIRMLLVMPSHGSIGGIEHFHMAVASFLKEDSSFALRMLIKLVGESEIDANLSAFLEDLGVPHQTYRRPIDVPTKLLAWPHIVYSQNPIPEVCLFAKMLRKKLVITHHNWLKRPYSVQGLRWRIASSLRPPDACMPFAYSCREWPATRCLHQPCLRPIVR